MKEETITIIEYRLERARETLADAKQLFNKGSLYSIVNRIYYAMFYSVTALLLTKNLSSSKHSGIKSLFGREFINTEIVDKDYGRFYSQIFERRQKGDYEDLVEFKKEKVKKWLEKAEEFVNEIVALTLKLIEDQKRNQGQ